MGALMWGSHSGCVNVGELQWKSYPGGVTVVELCWVVRTNHHFDKYTLRKFYLPFGLETAKLASNCSIVLTLLNNLFHTLGLFCF